MNAIIPSSPHFDTSAIDRAALASSTKNKYRRELIAMAAAGVDPRDHSRLQQYADGLKSSRKQFLKSALRLMVQGIEQDIKANATPGNIADVQASLYRLDAMKNAVTVPQHSGAKAHVWLSQRQVTEITSLCGDSLEGKRDWIVLGVLLGAGLRREELATLTFDAIKKQPMKNGGTRTVLQVTGKGAKNRVIPISAKLAFRLHEWKDICNGGRMARAMKRGELMDSMSAVSIYELVARYGERIGIEGLAPHDLRRTYAQIGMDSNVPLTQISVCLGHSSVQTTAKYLNLSLDLTSTISDFVPLS